MWCQLSQITISSFEMSYYPPPELSTGRPNCHNQFIPYKIRHSPSLFTDKIKSNNAKEKEKKPVRESVVYCMVSTTFESLDRQQKVRVGDSNTFQNLVICMPKNQISKENCKATYKIIFTVSCKTKRIPRKIKPFSVNFTRML